MSFSNDLSPYPFRHNNVIKTEEQPLREKVFLHPRLPENHSSHTKFKSEFEKFMKKEMEEIVKK